MDAQRRPERPGAVVAPGQDQARHQVLEHQEEVGEVLVDGGELPDVEEGEEETRDRVGHRPAAGLQSPEDQAPEEDLLNEGGQQHHDQKGGPGGGADLGGDDGVVEVHPVMEPGGAESEEELVEAVEGHKAHAHGLAG